MFHNPINGSQLKVTAVLDDIDPIAVKLQKEETPLPDGNEYYDFYDDGEMVIDGKTERCAILVRKTVSQEEAVYNSAFKLPI